MARDGVSSFDEVRSDDVALNYNEGSTVERCKLLILRISNTSRFFSLETYKHHFDRYYLFEFADVILRSRDRMTLFSLPSSLFF